MPGSLVPPWGTGVLKILYVKMLFVLDCQPLILQRELIFGILINLIEIGLCRVHDKVWFNCITRPGSVRYLKM